MESVSECHVPGRSGDEFGQIWSGWCCLTTEVAKGASMEMRFRCSCDIIIG